MLTDHIRFNRIIFRDQVFTGDYLTRAVDECALFLDRHIRSNSPVVYLFAPSHIKTVIGFLAIAKTGRAALLVDPRVGKLEYEEMLEDTRPGAIIKIQPETIPFDLEKEITLTDAEMTREEIAQLEEVCLLKYSNAEDGYAKAAMLTHGNLRANAESIADGNNVDNHSLSCAILPLHHLYGFQNGMLTPFVANGAFLINELIDLRNTDQLVSTISKYKATHLYSIPIVYYLLSKIKGDKNIFKHVYSFISGAYKLPFSIRERFGKRFGMRLHEGYGLTEASPVCTWQFKQEPFEMLSVGRPIKGCEVKIFDENNQEAPFGEKGEIVIRGDHVMKGYFNHTDATNKTIINRWLKTGDYGKQDINGFVYFLGLKKEMFNVIGYKVYKNELIRMVMKNKIVESCDFSSHYDEIKGDQIKSKIKLTINDKRFIQDFHKWCTENISYFKHPKIIDFLMG
ncbi:MAG: AMP-binding protein [Chitinispirillaceae bacterium]|nr:AMP-binding protein [Chitinispirillaceae bacterium]